MLRFRLWFSRRSPARTRNDAWCTCPIAFHDSTSWPTISGGAGIPTRAISSGVSTTPLWRLTAHNPVRMLQLLPPETLERALNDREWLALYDRAIARLDAARAAHNTWCREPSFPKSAVASIAYFSAEFALHQSLPIYAGGLGVLAGDHCKEASDLGVPLIGVGFMYPQGYFHQSITFDGWQEEVYEKLNWTDAPIEPAMTPDGKPCVTAVPLGNRTVLVAVWRVRVGRVKLYLLDTDLEENAPWDRESVGPPLRRRPRDARAAGDHPRHRRRARAQGDGHPIRPSITSTKATRRSSCCSASAISARRAGASTRRSRKCGERRCSRRTRRWRPGTTRFRFTWSKRTSPARGATSAAIASGSSRSATTTTAAGRCST